MPAIDTADVLVAAKLQVLGITKPPTSVSVASRTGGLFRRTPASTLPTTNTMSVGAPVNFESYDAGGGGGTVNTPPMVPARFSPPTTDSRRVSPSLVAGQARGSSDLPPMQLLPPNTSRGDSLTASRRVSAQLGTDTDTDLGSFSNDEASTALVAAMGRLTESWWAKAAVKRISPLSPGYLAIATQTPTPSNPKAPLTAALLTIDREISNPSTGFAICDVPRGFEGWEGDWRLLAQVCVEIPIVWTALLRPLAPESSYLESILLGTYTDPSPHGLLPPFVPQPRPSEVATPAAEEATVRGASNRINSGNVKPPITIAAHPDNVLLSSWVVVADSWKAGRAFIARFKSRNPHAPYIRKPGAPQQSAEEMPSNSFVDVPPYVMQLRYMSRLPQVVAQGIFLVAEVLRALVVQPNAVACMSALSALHYLLVHHSLLTHQIMGDVGLGPKIPAPQPHWFSGSPSSTASDSASHHQSWKVQPKCNFVVVLEKLYVGLSLRFQLFFGTALFKPLTSAKSPSVTNDGEGGGGQPSISLDACLGTTPTQCVSEKTPFVLSSQHGRTMSLRFGALLAGSYCADGQASTPLNSPPMLLKPVVHTPGSLFPPSDAHPPAGSFGSFPSEGGVVGGPTPRGGHPDSFLSNSLFGSYQPHNSGVGRRSDLSSNYFASPPGGSSGGLAGAVPASLTPDQMMIVPHIAPTPLGASLIAIRTALRKLGFTTINIALVVDVRHMMGFNSETKFGRPGTTNLKPHKHMMCWRENAFIASSKVDEESKAHELWLGELLSSQARATSSTGMGEGDFIAETIRLAQQATSSDSFVGCVLSPVTMAAETMKHMVLVTALKTPEIRGSEGRVAHAMLRGRDRVILVVAAPHNVIEAGPFYLVISATVPDAAAAPQTRGPPSAASSTKPSGGIFSRIFGSRNSNRKNSTFDDDDKTSQYSRSTQAQGLETRSDAELERMLTNSVLPHANAFHSQFVMSPQAGIIRFEQAD